MPGVLLFFTYFHRQTVCLRRAVVVYEMDGEGLDCSRWELKNAV